MGHEADRLTDLHTEVSGVTQARFQYDLNRQGLRTRSTTTVAGLPPSTQVITYTYDGVQRLTRAEESTGTTTGYGYDRVGNRVATSIGGVNSLIPHNAANQREGESYDAVGNLLGPGGTTYAYDALGRLVSAAGGAMQYGYNGDGVLVAETAGGTTTRYTQDLAAPLSQLLSDGSTRFIYGHGRVVAFDGALNGTWELHDALGSVRQTLDDGGVALAASRLGYSPFGVPASGATPRPFGFTGEMQDAATGLVYLRARWYDPAAGTFLGRDPFAGFPTRPYSQHFYQYAYSAPTMWTDPSGECVSGTADTVFCGVVIGAGTATAAAATVIVAIPAIALTGFYATHPEQWENLKRGAHYVATAGQGYTAPWHSQPMDPGPSPEIILSDPLPESEKLQVLGFPGTVTDEMCIPSGFDLSLPTIEDLIWPGADLDAGSELGPEWVLTVGELPLFDQEGVDYTPHFIQEMQADNISEQEALDTFLNGKKYTSKYGDAISYKDGVTIAVDKSTKKVITAWRGDEKRTWQQGWPHMMWYP